MLTLDWKCTLIQNNAIAGFKQSRTYCMTLNDTRDQVGKESKSNVIELINTYIQIKNQWHLSNKIKVQPPCKSVI